jgi:ABC-type multidrug transport system ATPase subunit
MRLVYCKDRRIGGALQRGLSTGERKRLNVAMELLPVASVLFLDEPTTGLDSNTGREIIANVVEVTRLRKLACIATIHQPSYTILSQFDYLLALAKGKLCFYGRITDAILYFESLGIPVAGNPAEVYADALAAQPDRLIEAWEGSAERTILQKKVEAIHSGQGSINEVVAKADSDPTLADRMGFYQ